jgi:hypothetical protein
VLNPVEEPSLASIGASGFKGNRPFTTMNQRLAQRGLPKIEWDLSLA